MSEQKRSFLPLLRFIGCGRHFGRDAATRSPGGAGDRTVDRPTDEQIGNWYPRLYRTALRLTGSPEDAADVTQQAFYQALGRWDRFDGGALRTTWLYQILVNCVRDWARRRMRRGQTVDLWTVAALPQTDSSPGDRLARREEVQRLREAIADLQADLRVAFVATVLDGYTYEEAAELLSVPVGTVASRVHGARKHLQGVMQQAFPEA